jgi:hypothetical protein
MPSRLFVCLHEHPQATKEAQPDGMRVTCFVSSLSGLSGESHTDTMEDEDSFLGGSDSASHVDASSAPTKKKNAVPPQWEGMSVTSGGTHEGGSVMGSSVCYEEDPDAPSSVGGHTNRSSADVKVIDLSGPKTKRAAYPNYTVV